MLADRSTMHLKQSCWGFVVFLVPIAHAWIPGIPGTALFRAGHLSLFQCNRSAMSGTDTQTAAARRRKSYHPTRVLSCPKSCSFTAPTPPTDSDLCRSAMCSRSHTFSCPLVPHSFDCWRRFTASGSQSGTHSEEESWGKLPPPPQEEEEDLIYGDLTFIDSVEEFAGVAKVRARTASVSSRYLTRFLAFAVSFPLSRASLPSATFASTLVSPSVNKT